MEIEKSTSRPITPFEKAQISLTFISPFLIIVFFILFFIPTIKFDKNTFHPLYNTISNNYSEIEKTEFHFNGEKDDNKINEIKNLKNSIFENAKIFNEGQAIIKNKDMVNLSLIYSKYETLFDKIIREYRHEKYLNENEYQDIIELSPNKEQLIAVNHALPKPFFTSFLKCIFFAILIQTIIYFVTLYILKKFYNYSKKEDDISSHP